MTSAIIFRAQSQFTNLGGHNASPDVETTWWGFPTWRETLSPNWTDPTVQVNVGLAANGSPVLATAAVPGQPAGLVPLTAGEVANGQVNGYNPGNANSRALLPSTTSLWRNNPDPFSDGAGDNAGANYFFGTATSSTLWNSQSWEDDLIMTGVRSFDVKAYDNALAGYGDLGWGDDLRFYVPYSTYSAVV